MSERTLGDVSVHPIGLGCMPMSGRRMLAERPRALATVHAALDSGVTLLDTANVYAPSADQLGHNERLVAEALRTWAASPGDRERVVVATKGGISRTPGPNGDRWGRAGSPAALAAAARASAARLDVAVIDLYYLHRPDPDVPFDEQVGGLAQVRDDGVAARIALSNVNLAQLDEALELVGGPEQGGIVAVQNEFSPRYREHADVLGRCAERGLAFVPWSPLGGVREAAQLGSRHAVFAEVAAELDATAQQVALAWLMSLAPVIVPIPGSTRPETAKASAQAAGLVLSDEQRMRLGVSPAEDVSLFPR